MSLLTDFDQAAAGDDLGARMHRLASELYPICRSITGNGLRQTLRILQQRLPLNLVEVPSGTEVFDWTIPKEWNIQDAFIRTADGTRILDFQKCSLHVVNYSAPIQATLSLEQLRPHLYSLSEQPDWIPYRTSYYEESWGFCLSHRQMLELKDGEYEVCIDSSLKDGYLTYGEYYLAGESNREVLISCHVCHPSLANDNLSGLVVSAFMARFLKCRKQHLRYSYRFLFVPGTIGAITWLALHRETVSRIQHGLVLTCVGDAGGFHYKRSRRGDAEVDRAATHVLQYCGEGHEFLDFSPYGYDERQYCSPGFDLPVGCLMRSVWGQFPEYHTSADNLEFIHAKKLAESLRVCISILDVLENNRAYRNQNPYCEPQLGKRKLYRPTGGGAISLENVARLWVLNLSDGNHSLLDIAERAKLPFSAVWESAQILFENGLLSLADQQ